MKVVTSREFNQDVSQAKRFARLEPVFVTDRGKPTHVLMSIDAWRQLTGHAETMVDLLAMPGLGDIDLDAARSGDAWDRQERIG
jgi:PHD/YefM family antitoxin component YafN of YafNO toxin-antitoxin module